MVKSMRFNRTKNAARNIFYGFILKIYQLLVPFLMRTIMIYFLGMQYLGLDSLFTSVLQVLNLAELGVGSAMVYSMYEPMVVNDRRKIRSLLHLYRMYYRMIGFVILVVGLIFTPFIPHLIHGNIPSDMNLYVLYILNLLATVASYWIYAYKSSILNAYQRNDIISKITLLTNTIRYIFQILVIISFKNYYGYLIVALGSQILTNIIIAVITGKLYPDLTVGEPLAKEEVKVINERIRDLMTAKLGGVVLAPSDTLIISYFLGLTVLAQYQNYFYIVTAVAAMIGVVFASVTAGVGNSLIVESKKKNFQDLTKFTFIICWVSGIGSACMLTMYQPFIELWVGKLNMLDYGVVICLAVYFFVTVLNQLLNLYKDAGGVWRRDRFRPLIVSLINIILNILIVQIWGVYGALLSTVLSMIFVGMPWLMYNLFTTIFDIKFFKRYFYKLIYYVSITIIGCVISVFLCSLIKTNLIITLVLNAIISIVVMDVLYILAYHNQVEFVEVARLADKLTAHKIRFLRKIF